MKKRTNWLPLVVGILMILVGGIWALQGVGIFTMVDSPMIGVSFWVWAGLAVVLLGIGVVAVSLRRSPPSA